MTIQDSSFMFSSAPGIGSASVRSTDQEGKTFWKNRVQHLFFFLGYCMNMRKLSSLIYEDAMTNPKHVPSILQTVLVCAIIGGPLVFIQMFIGQFARKGCIAIGSMVPAMYGFGYSMMIVALFDCVQSLYYSGSSLLYFLVSILNFPYPPWMDCTDEMYERFPNCFSRSDIDLCQSCTEVGGKPCFEPGSRILSAKLFSRLIAFERNDSYTDPTKIGPPQSKSVTHVFLTILFVYIVTSRTFKNLELSLRISLIFSLLAVSVTSVVPLFDGKIWTAVIKFWNLRFESLGEATTWMAVFRRVTDALNIGSGGHVLLGSYMTPDTASHFRALYLIGYFILFVVLYHAHYFLIATLFQCRLNMPNYGFRSDKDISFVMFPTELGLSATPQLWCTLHFAVYWLLSVSSIGLQIALVNESLSEEFKIGEYHMYTRCVICIAVFVFCLPLTTKGGAYIAHTVASVLKIINLLVITLIFVIIFLYNIQRLKDDIHFVLNTPPTWYIQTCWILTAFITWVMLFFQIWRYPSNSEFYIVKLPIYLLAGLPIVIGFTAKLIEYAKKRNITGMFRPSLYYGAPDFNTRLMRILFNPRMEVRYRRRKDVCKHRCLLNNEIAVRAMEKELQFLQQLAYDLRHNEEYREEYNDVIAELNEHHRVMYVRFSMVEQRAGPHGKLQS